jgi:hypothetical protein
MIIINTLVLIGCSFEEVLYDFLYLADVNISEAHSSAAFESQYSMLFVAVVIFSLG